MRFSVIPPATLAILRLGDVSQRPLARLAQLRVLRHPVGFIQRQGRNRVAVHPAVRIRPLIRLEIESTIDRLPCRDPIQGSLHLPGVLELAMRVARSLESEQRQTGRGHVAVELSLFLRMAGVESTERPAAVGSLMPREEL